MLFFIVDDDQYRSGKMSPYLLALLLFRIFWNSEYKDNEFKKPERKIHKLQFIQIVKALYPQPNLETSRPF